MAENVFKDKALQKYLGDISRIKPLSREDELELAIKAKNGDEDAKAILIRSNLKFVVKIASRYQNRGLTLSELISEGNMGLITAIEKFDTEKDIKLISYAVWWIRQRILFALSEKVSVIRTPLGKANAANKIKKAKEQIFSDTGHHATLAEIVEKTNLKPKVVDKIERQVTDAVSLEDVSYSNKHDEVTLLNFMEDINAEDPKRIYYKDKLNSKIHDSISNLAERDAFIIKSYFGLEGKDGKNFAQIAEELGISRERVRQIQKEALKKIMADTYETYKADIDYLLN